MNSVGANTFQTYSDGADVHTAFRNAVEDAGWQYGHRGYTGTIAEKPEHVIITSPAMSRDDAVRRARDLIERNDARVADTWGPAGAIPVRQATNPVDRSDPDGCSSAGPAADRRRSGPLPCPIVAASSAPSAQRL